MNARLKRLSDIAACLILVAHVGFATSVFAQQPFDAGSEASEPQSSPTGSETTVASEADRIIQLRALLQSDRRWHAKLKAELQHIEAEYKSALERFAQLDQLARQSQAAERPDQDDDRQATRHRVDSLMQERGAIRKQLTTLAAKISLEAGILNDIELGRQPRLEQIDNRPTQPEAGAAHDSNMAVSAANVTAQEPPQQDGPVTDSAVLVAREELRQAEAKRDRAIDALELVDRAIEVFDEDLQSAKQVYEAAQLKLEAGAAAGAEVADAAQEEVHQHRQRVAGSEAILAELRDERERIATRLEELVNAASVTARRLHFVKSPLAPHRLSAWAIRVGPRIVLILLIAVFFRWLAGNLARRVVATMIRRGRGGYQAERNERAETLSRVFRSTSSVVIAALTGLAILTEVGIDVTVLLGGAAVIGTAIAFGSQNLVKDYFAGFMVLLENQYNVGNVIKIGGMSGTVEDITLRITVLRDLAGVVHFVPHNQIGTVSNLTYGWSKVVFDIGVAYKEDVQHVMAVLMETAQALKKDATFGPDILEEPQMLGVDEFQDSAVVIRFVIKTSPHKRWAIKREMLRRIKVRFDQLGIEIPYPHRTVFQMPTT